jgi:hypothetical protein
VDLEVSVVDLEVVVVDLEVSVVDLEVAVVDLEVSVVVFLVEGKQLSKFLIRCINFILSIYIGSVGGLGGLGGLGGIRGPGGIIRGVPIGFGVTTTVGGFGPTGIPPPGVGGVRGAFNREFRRGPYRRGF